VADLTPEPTNPYDKNAVVVTVAGEKVGYLSRDEAPRYLEALREAGFDGQSAKVAAKIVGGWRTNQHDAGHFGVKLAMPWPVKFES
jgi:collagen type III alpha